MPRLRESTAGRVLLKVFFGFLILFLLVSWLWGSVFLWQLAKLYTHGGDKLLARLAAYNIRLGEKGGLTNLTTPSLDSDSLSAYCWSPEEGSWGRFILRWDPSEIESRKRSLLNPEENRREKREIHYLRPDLFLRTWVDERFVIRRTYFLTGNNWALEWTWILNEGPERLEEFLAGLAAEERGLPYRWRVEYYRSMALKDWVWLGTYFEEHGFGPLTFLAAFIVIPKTAVQLPWLYVFALVPGPALRYAVPVWHAGIVSALVALVYAFRSRQKS